MCTWLSDWKTSLWCGPIINRKHDLNSGEKNGISTTLPFYSATKGEKNVGKMWPYLLFFFFLWLSKSVYPLLLLWLENCVVVWNSYWKKLQLCRCCQIGIDQQKISQVHIHSFSSCYDEATFYIKFIYFSWKFY